MAIQEEQNNSTEAEEMNRHEHCGFVRLQSHVTETARIRHGLCLLLLAASLFVVCDANEVDDSFLRQRTLGYYQPPPEKDSKVVRIPSGLFEDRTPFWETKPKEKTPHVEQVVEKSVAKDFVSLENAESPSFLAVVNESRPTQENEFEKFGGVQGTDDTQMTPRTPTWTQVSRPMPTPTNTLPPLEDVGEDIFVLKPDEHNIHDTTTVAGNDSLQDDEEQVLFTAHGELDDVLTTQTRTKSTNINRPSRLYGQATDKEHQEYLAKSKQQNRLLVHYTNAQGRDLILNTASKIHHDIPNEQVMAVDIESTEDYEMLEASAWIDKIEEDSLWTELGYRERIVDPEELRSGEYWKDQYGHSNNGETGSVRRRKRRSLQEQVPYGIPMIQADQVAAGPHPVKVCIVDTGLGIGHPDIDSSLADGINRESDVDGQVLRWDEDLRGHGTHVTGIMSARKDNNLGIRGVGDVHVYVTRGLDNEGRAYESDIREAMEQCEAAGAKIVNLSLGGSKMSSTMKTICDRLYKKGFLIFAAAGNSGEWRLEYPASDPTVVSVSAVDSLEWYWANANYGPTQELMAPGVSIISTTWSEEFGYTYAEYSGTSMATPHASAAAALLWSHRPECSNQQIRYALAYTAKDKGAEGCDTDFGYGIIQIKDALDFLNTYPCVDANWGQLHGAGNCTTIDQEPDPSHTFPPSEPPSAAPSKVPSNTPTSTPSASLETPLPTGSPSKMPSAPSELTPAPTGAPSLSVSAETAPPTASPTSLVLNEDETPTQSPAVSLSAAPTATPTSTSSVAPVPSPPPSPSEPVMGTIPRRTVSPSPPPTAPTPAPTPGPTLPPIPTPIPPTNIPSTAPTKIPTSAISPAPTSHDKPAETRLPISTESPTAAPVAQIQPDDASSPTTFGADEVLPTDSTTTTSTNTPGSRQWFRTPSGEVKSASMWRDRRYNSNNDDHSSDSNNRPAGTSSSDDMPTTPNGRLTSLNNNKKDGDFFQRSEWLPTLVSNTWANIFGRTGGSQEKEETPRRRRGWNRST